MKAESMTGYGEARAKIAGTSYICRVRSLNHRFLDLKVRLPRADLATLDLAIRKRLSDSFQRGAIEFTLAIEPGAEGTDTSINTKLAKAYYNEAKKLAKLLKQKNALSIDALLRLPGVVSSATNEEALREVSNDELLKQLVDPALSALKQARQLEGKKLCNHLLSLLGEMQQHLEKIKGLEEPEKERSRKLIIDRAHETLKLLSQIGGTAAASSEFENRLREEAVFWIERRDFEEERVRLEMHIHNMRDLIDTSKEVSGRKLEFTQQELLREVNTLGTKAQSPGITEHTIELKSILERLKEQLANVE